MELTALLHTLGKNETLAQWGWNIPTLHSTGTENSIHIFLEKELRGHSPNFHLHVSVSALYIPTIDLPILLQEICGPILGIYKSLTDTRENWD